MTIQLDSDQMQRDLDLAVEEVESLKEQREEQHLRHMLDQTTWASCTDVQQQLNIAINNNKALGDQAGRNTIAALLETLEDQRQRLERRTTLRGKDSLLRVFSQLQAACVLLIDTMDEGSNTN